MWLKEYLTDKAELERDLQDADEKAKVSCTDLEPCIVVKTLQFNLCPSFQHPSVLTPLVRYHATFIIAY
ncbi:hypothetical protein VTI74DRAFT_8111 [Chaetomium olivicolor]